MNRTKPTQSERRRRIEKEVARLQALTTPAPPLTDDLEAILVNYMPRRVDPDRWNTGLGDFILDLVRRGQCSGEATVRQLLSEVTLYANWAIDQGTPMTMDDLLDHDLIDRWVAVHTSGPQDSTWLNRRSRVRNLASRIHPSAKAPERPAPFSRRALKAPYTLVEVAALERLALAQPTASLRRQLCAMVGLGLGAGLSSADLRHLTAGHVSHDLAGTFVVEVPGDRSRTVQVQGRYVPFVEEGLKRIPRAQLVLGRDPGRGSITAGIVARAAIGTTSVVPDQARLRSTWILVQMTSPVPLATLLQIAGITTGTTLTDLLPYATDPSYVTGGAGDADTQ
jgi:hypothetical protein